MKMYLPATGSRTTCRSAGSLGTNAVRRRGSTARSTSISSRRTILFVDHGKFFKTALAAMRAPIRELKGRRVFLDDGSRYWHLKPDFRFAEVVTI